MAPDPDHPGEPRGQVAVDQVRPAAGRDGVRARTLRLPAEPSAPARARAELRSLLAPAHLPAERLYELQLLLTELVSNAVRHGSRAGDAVEIVFEHLRDELRVSVTDAGRGLSVPRVRSASGAALSGRGLRAVQRLSDEWAADTAAGRCAVWFRAGLPPQPAPG